ncbi:type II toxin-antitoxin system RelE/ParE family toxin [Candidatus Sumerlaeota bacterium]|nr:type II toxin-antitoxin system RelE/ParE family toxin [Candidatus Sumerlaeota bacterium]
MYEVLLTKDRIEFYKSCPTALARRLNRCFEQLEKNPYLHPNIKALKGKLKGLYHYRVGEYRIIYEILEKKKQVLVLLIVHRKGAY